MDSWVYCKECKTIDDCSYSSGMRCNKRQSLINQQLSGIGIGFYPTTPKSDMEIISERLQKIEKVLENLLLKERDEINKRIGVKIDEEWIKHLDKIQKINKKLAVRHFEGGDWGWDFDEEFKKEWDLLEGE